MESSMDTIRRRLDEKRDPHRPRVSMTLRRQYDGGVAG
jgi:hypothetical protein